MYIFIFRLYMYIFHVFIVDTSNIHTFSHLQNLYIQERNMKYTNFVNLRSIPVFYIELQRINNR